MANPNFDRWLFSPRGLRAFFQTFQLKFPRPLLGGPLRSQVLGFYPGSLESKLRAYERLKAAFSAGLNLTEAPSDEQLFLRAIPIYSAGCNAPGSNRKRITYQLRSEFLVTKPGQEPRVEIRSITVQSDESLTRGELESKHLGSVTGSGNIRSTSPELGSETEVRLIETKIEWVIRCY